MYDEIIELKKVGPSLLSADRVRIGPARQRGRGQPGAARAECEPHSGTCAPAGWRPWLEKRPAPAAPVLCECGAGEATFRPSAREAGLVARLCGAPLSASSRRCSQDPPWVLAQPASSRPPCPRLPRDDLQTQRGQRSVQSQARTGISVKVNVSHAVSHPLECTLR